MNKKAMREEHLIKMLRSAGRISTNDAVTMLGVSEATVRRMLVDMEKRGEVVRSYGGIQLAGASDSYSFEKHEKVLQAEKQRIGCAAAALVENADTIYLDCGTTLFQMALALGKRLAGGEFKSLNIITNSIANVQALPPSDNCRVILAGGEYHFERRYFFGPITERYLEPFYFTKCFLGCEGASIQMGFTSNSIGVSSLNANVIRRSDAAVILLDKGKFGRNALTAYASFDQVDSVVTEEQPDARFCQAMAAADVRILVAP